MNHFGVVPDLITFAKGVNSGYVPLGGVVISQRIASHFDTLSFQGGLTHSGHPLACAAGVATCEVFERDGILERVRDLGTRVVAPRLREIADRHPSVGEVRGLGLFWAIELVKDAATREPLVPFNASGPDVAPMADIVAACKQAGLWPFTHFNRMHIAPPLVITEEELNRGPGHHQDQLHSEDRASAARSGTRVGVNYPGRSRNSLYPDGHGAN